MSDVERRPSLISRLEEIDRRETFKDRVDAAFFRRFLDIQDEAEQAEIESAERNKVRGPNVIDFRPKAPEV